MADGGFDPAEILATMTEAARAAGDLALAHFRDGETTTAQISYKGGGSPVTAADFAVDRFLEPALRASLPQAGYVSEEKADDRERLQREALFIVDPIDGTRAFVRGDRRWAVSVALVIAGRPTLAVLRLPALDQTFTARRGGGAALNGSPIWTSDRARLDGARLAAPASLLERLRGSGLNLQAEGRIPSLAYRIAKVASGTLDAGVASADSYDWDIAAADLILREAGGLLCDFAGQLQTYNAPDLRHGALAAAGVRLMPEMLEAVRALDPSSQSS